MDDHFWPSIYPAIAVGLLLGLAYGGVRLASAGTLGGLIGGSAAYYLAAAVGLDDGIAALALLVGLSALAAYALILLSKLLQSRA
jgi:hypothetical protein